MAGGPHAHANRDSDAYAGDSHTHANSPDPYGDTYTDTADYGSAVCLQEPIAGRETTVIRAVRANPPDTDLRFIFDTTYLMPTTSSCSNRTDGEAQSERFIAPASMTLRACQSGTTTVKLKGDKRPGTRQRERPYI